MQQKTVQLKANESEALQIETLIHKWGCSISEAILDYPCHYFSLDGVEGFIGYHIANNCAVVIGDPICQHALKPQLAEAFQKHCQENSWSYIYFIASKAFAEWAISNTCQIKIRVGDEMIFDPSRDPTLGHKSQKLRNYIHHAQQQGLSVKEYHPCDVDIENSILEVGKSWLKSRHGPQIYLGNLNFFQHRNERRWFYLLEGEKNIVGMSLLSRLEAYKGWLLKFHITLQDVPRGASELLIASTLETLRSENCTYLTYGMIPGDELTDISGITPSTAWLAKKAFSLTKWFFKLDKRKIFWSKFQPHSEDTYLLFSSSSIGITELKALVRSLKIDF